MDATTLTLAVDSTQVNSAAAALDKMAVAGGKAESSAALLTKASADQGKILGGALAPAAAKAAVGFKDLAAAQASLGPAAARQLAAGVAELAATEARATAAGAALDRLGNSAQAAGARVQGALSPTATSAATGVVAAAAPGLVAASAPADLKAGEAFLAQLAGQAATAGKTKTELLLMQAAELGVANQAKGLIAQIGAASKHTHEFGFATAGAKRELLVLGHELSQGNYKNFGGSLLVLGERTGAASLLFSGLGLAAIGVTAAIGAFAFAALKGAHESKALADSLVFTGNFAGQTEGQFNALSIAVAASTHSTIGSVREFAQALVSTGEIGPQVFAAATEAAVGYARATGKTADEVAKDFASLARSPTKFAAEANRAFNFLTLAQFAAIKSFEENGRAADAQGVIYDALNARFPKLQSNLGTLERLLQDGKNTWSSFWDAALDIGRTTTIEQKIGDVQGRLAAAQARAEGVQFGAAHIVPSENAPVKFGAFTFKDNRISALKQEESRLLEQKASEASIAAATAETAAQEKLRIAAFGAVEGYRSQVKGIALVTKELDKAKREFATLKGTAQEVPLAEQTRILADIRKRHSPAKDTEPEQVRKAVLVNDLDRLKEQFADERSATQFHLHELAAIYHSGSTSLVDYYRQRNDEIEAGVQDELRTLAKSRARITAELSNPLVKANPSERIKLENDLAKSVEASARVQTEASRAGRLNDLERAQAFKQLNDQVANYSANLLHLQGDEIGAAKIRAQQEIKQARILFNESGGQTQGQTTPGSDRGQVSRAAEQEAELRRTLDQNIAIQDARKQTGLITQRLAIEEERIALAASSGSISEIAALARVGEARSKVIAELEKQVIAQEAVSASRPQDFELKVSTERARLELDKLKAELDPLADKFRKLFSDVGGNAIGALLNGGKFKDVAKNFLGDITRQINADTGKAISGAVFGKGGPLGDIFASKGNAGGSFLGKIFGGTDPADTSAVSASLASLKTAGVDPATASLAAMQTAGLDPATASLGAFVAALNRAAAAAGATPGAIPAIPAIPASADRPAPTGEQSIADLFKEPATEASTLGSTLVDTSTAAKQFSGAIGPASIVLGTLGKAGGVAAQALSILPSIIAGVSASASVSGAGSAIGAGAASGEGGGFFSTVASFFGSFFHSGGVVGQTSDMRPVNPGVFAGAAKYHQGGVIGGGSLPGLKPDEVPAILRKNEEVLTADDPRHQQNIAPQLLKRIESGSTVLSALADGQPKPQTGLRALMPAQAQPGAVAAIVKEDKAQRELSPLTRYLLGSPATVQGLISQLSQENDLESVTALRDIQVAGRREMGGPVAANSTYRVNESGPEVFNVAGKSYLMTGSQAGSVTAAHDVRSAAAPQVNVTLNQNFAPGTDRQTIDQAAVRASQAINRSIARGTA